MKFAKKILVGLLVASLLICTLALSSSAQSAAKSPEYYENILEYGDCQVYFTEDFQGYEADLDFTDKVYPAAQPNTPDIGVMKFHNAGIIALESENKVLKVSAADKSGYFRWTKASDMPLSAVMSFKFKLGDNGAVVALNATMSDYYEDVALLTVDGSDASAVKLSYAAFDSRYVEYSEVVSNAALSVGEWYDVSVIFNTADGAFSLIVSDSDSELISVKVPANKSAGIDSLRLSVGNDENGTDKVAYFDDVALYEGKIVRDIYNPTGSLAAFVVEMDEYAKDSARTVEEKLAMADLYERFFLDPVNPYAPDTQLPNYTELKAIADGAKAYINKVNADALIEYVENIMKQTTCYDKLDYQVAVVKPFYDLFPSDEPSIDALPGMADIFADEVTYGDKVFAAKNKYDAATREIEDIKIRSAAFVNQLESAYDDKSMDYIHMVTQRDALSVLISKVDPAYRYGSKSEPLGNPDSDYKTAGDALAAYGALIAKIADIDATVGNFMPKVAALSKTEADSVSADNPYLTVNFATLYANYTEVKSLCNNGVVHPLLDSDTYPGLADAVAKFDEYMAYVEAREAECNTFVSLVNGASNVGLYYTTLEQLDIAAEYLDTNKEKSLELHTGVEEAIELYYNLREKLAKDFKNAEAYKAAVAAINIEASYAELRTQVNAAVALRDAGAIVGIAGIKEANVALIAAEKKITVYESNSTTLKNCVNALKDAASLEERRTLIFNANAVKDKAQDAIEGVTAAKTELANQIAKYNSDIAAANAVFESVVSDIVSVSAAACPTQGMYKMLEVTTALFK